MSTHQLNPSLLSQRLKPLYLGLLSSLGVYSVAVVVLSQSSGATPQTEDAAVLYSSLALGMCLLGMVINYALLKPHKINKSRDPGGAVFRAFLISWVCFDLAAILGVVMVSLSGSAEHFWMILTVSALSMLSHPPFEGKIKRALGGR